MSKDSKREISDDELLNQLVQQNQTSSEDWVMFAGAAFVTAAIVPICKCILNLVNFPR